MTPDDNSAKKEQAVRDENVRVADREMPGSRAALAPGSLQRRPVENQSDENRDQPLTPDGKRRLPDRPPGT